MTKSAKEKARKRAPVRAKSAEKPTPRPGRQANKPLCLLYKEGVDTVCALIVKPGKDFSLYKTSTGPHAALGKWKDMGYDFGGVVFTSKREQFPAWVRHHLLSNCIPIGYVSITSFPL